MLFALLAYFLTFYLVIKIKSKFKHKETSFPFLKFTKTGISFFSYNQHEIKIQNMKTMQIDGLVYLKNGDKLIIISNVKDVKIYEDYLLFTANGETKILFDCKEYYRYFTLDIQSEQFNLNNIKQTAILDIMNNNFDLNSSSLAKRYMNLLKNILNIHIDNEKIVVKPNKFKFSFVVTYKINNKIKQVNIRQRI